MEFLSDSFLSTNLIRRSEFQQLIEVKGLFVPLTLPLPHRIIECRNDGIMGSKSGKTRAFIPAHNAIAQPICVNLKKKKG